MWKSLLGLLLVAVVQCLQEQQGPLENTIEQAQDGRRDELENVDAPLILALKLEIETSMAQILEAHQSHYDKRVRETNNKIGTISREVLAGIEGKLTPLKEEITLLKQQVAQLATRDGLVEMETDLSALVVSSTTGIENALTSLARESTVAAKIQELADIHLANINRWCWTPARPSPPVTSTGAWPTWSSWSTTPMRPSRNWRPQFRLPSLAGLSAVSQVQQLCPTSWITCRRA